MKSIKTNCCVTLGCALSIFSINALANENYQQLVSLDIPEHLIEKQALHFSHAISSTDNLILRDTGYSNDSDEYWFEATGSQLSTGVDLSISHPGSLIRISSKKGKHDYLLTDTAIDPKNIALFVKGKEKNKLINPFKQSVSQQQLATANIFPNSSAIILNEKVGLGLFTLKVEQRLIGEHNYIVNVKEKNSKYKSQIKTPSQSYLAGQLVDFQASISYDGNVLIDNEHTAYVQFPSGSRKPVEVLSKGDLFQVKVPENIGTEKIGQLYELHLESKAIDKGVKIQRNNKFAFAISQPTAKLMKVAKVNNSEAFVELEVASEGRYEISAIISGVNNKGQLTPGMLSRSAYYLQPGKQQIELRFDTGILNELGMRSPFSLNHLKLVDQSRMAVLSQ